MKNPVLLLYLGSDGISQHSAHFLLHLSWGLIPSGATSPEQRHSSSLSLQWSDCWLLRRKLPQITVHQLLVFTRQDPHTSLCPRSVGFCKCSFAVPSGALGGMQALLLLAVFLSHQYTLMKWNVVLLQSPRVPWHLQSGNCSFLQTVSVGVLRLGGNYWNNSCS